MWVDEIQDHANAAVTTRLFLTLPQNGFSATIYPGHFLLVAMTSFEFYGAIQTSCQLEETPMGLLLKRVDSPPRTRPLTVEFR
jgi:hypothetical protein